MAKWQPKPDHKGGFYPESKVYFDGSHFIAIPHTNRPQKPRKKPVEEVITVVEETDRENENKPISEEENKQDEELRADELNDVESDEEAIAKEKDNTRSDEKKQDKKKVKSMTMTKKELFEKLYKAYFDKKKEERRKKIIEAMLPYFNDLQETENYVDLNLDRKHRNLVVRRVRMVRKANLANFNYFCTFTYDDNKHTEHSFKKKLKQVLRNMTYRKDWKYLGVWERGKDTERLHFHGLFNIPEGTLPGEFITVKDYNTSKHRMQTAEVNSYFWERFGRNEFDPINTKADLGKACVYIMKYIEKTGEKIVYSKNLPMYFISDIKDEDILCTIGMEDQKFLLFDDFACWDEGCYVGQVSDDVIKQMRKSNQ